MSDGDDSGSVKGMVTKKGRAPRRRMARKLEEDEPRAVLERMDEFEVIDLMVLAGRLVARDR